MNSLPHTERRPDGAAPVRQTSVRRQPRPADPDLVRLDDDIKALEDRGRMEPEQRCRVVLLRRKLGWLVRDRESGNSQYRNDARNLRLAVDREMAVTHA